MYLIIDKATNEILWKNNAPLHQKLQGKEIWHKFDEETQSVIEREADLPKDFTIENGEIREVVKEIPVDISEKVSVSKNTVQSSYILQLIVFEKEKELGLPLTVNEESYKKIKSFLTSKDFSEKDFFKREELPV